VDDTDGADIVLRFDKKTDREKQSSQSTDEKGTTTYSGAELFLPGSYAGLSEGADSPFYRTKTDDSKRKAGISCVTTFERAWIEAR